MSLVSIEFILFVLVLLTGYYLVPKAYQWVVLLGASLVFYAVSSAWSTVFVLITSVTVYFSTVRMNALSAEQKKYLKENSASLTREEKAEVREKTKKRRKCIMVCTILFNVGILCVFKYSLFAVTQVNRVIALFGLRTIEYNLNLPAVLGISFYTFQSMGYVVDVYWETTQAEKNYFKTLLFVSFFPQVTQGPISSFDRLSAELFREHDFSADNFINGAERMIAGFAKKLILANLLSPYVTEIFTNYQQYSGMTAIVGAFFYSIQIYADFSGYMDIVCGLCELFGIRLAENFERPYFSKSVAEYWRRWHMTLGEWFKKYIYYPIGVSKWNRRLGKALTQKLGKTVGSNLPATIALLVVWMTTGLWHGATLGYVAWGLVNGVFIIFSMWMEPVYASCRRALKVNEGSFLWRAFQTIRTFLLVTLIKVLPEVGSLRSGLGYWKWMFIEHTIPHGIEELLPFAMPIPLLLIAAGTLILFVTSLIQRKTPVRVWFGKLPAVVRLLILAIFTVMSLYYGSSGTAGGFMYAQF